MFRIHRTYTIAESEFVQAQVLVLRCQHVSRCAFRLHGETTHWEILAYVFPRKCFCDRVQTGSWYGLVRTKKKRLAPQLLVSFITRWIPVSIYSGIQSNEVYVFSWKSLTILISSVPQGGRPDVMGLIKEAYVSWNAEIVFITSNRTGNKEMMEGCKEAGIPAFVSRVYIFLLPCLM